jgi:hypothetical protein
MKKLLADRTLKAMIPAAPGTRKMIWDSAIPSFGVRVTNKGQTTFLVMRRMNGKLLRRTLGRYPIMTLAEVREAALEALRDIAEGIDTKVRQEAERRAEAQRQANSFAAVADDFITRHVRKAALCQGR